MKLELIKNQMPNLKLHGRTIFDEEKQALFFNWTCAGIEFNFCGTKLDAEFLADPGQEIEGLPFDTTAPRRDTWPWVSVFFDGEEEPLISFELGCEKEIKTLFESKTQETHQIRIVKLTENSKSYVGINGFEMEGQILELDEKKSKKTIEFIGDSITCGFGNMVEDRDRLFFSEDENGWMSYASIAARTLDMDWNMVCMSGICSQLRTGMPMDYGMNDLYLYTDRIWQDRFRKDQELQKWDFASNAKDYVVINLGTNDATGIMLSEDQDGELEKFYQGYMDFVKTVRACNGPKTRIICALGSMDYYLYHDILEIVKEYQQQTGDQNISCLRFKKMAAFDPIGACGHPNVVTDKKMAAELVAELKRLG